MKKIILILISLVLVQNVFACPQHHAKSNKKGTQVAKHNEHSCHCNDAVSTEES